MGAEAVLLDLLIWRGDPVQVLVFSLFFFLLSILMSKLCCSRRKSDSIRLGDPRRGHRWCDMDFLHRPTYCSVCEQATVAGQCCEACGLCICSEEKCINQSNKEFACKHKDYPPVTQRPMYGDYPPVTQRQCIVFRQCTRCMVLALSARSSMKHHWQRGNTPLCSNCFVCSEPCGTEPRLCDLRCVWCRRTAHENCLGSRTTRECDMGPHRSLIIPPYALSLKVVGWRSGQRAVINELSAPAGSEAWMPLLVLANPRSGGNDGEILMRAFRSLLNPAQIFDLTEVGPESVLDLCRLLSTHRCRVLVCGGDGTVGWVLSSLDKLNLPLKPDIAICPLGTGNDLARVLGWGSGYTGEAPEDILHDVQHAKITPVDRWKVSIGRLGLLSLSRPLKTLMMNNYFGIGCDALVVLNFHKTRESRPDLFTNRIFNKAWYLGYGVKDVLDAACKNLHQKIEVELDGVHVELPELEGVVVTNINSWCGGCPIWTTEQILSSTLDRTLSSSLSRSSSGDLCTLRNQRTVGSITPSSSVDAPSRVHRDDVHHHSPAADFSADDDDVDDDAISASSRDQLASRTNGSSPDVGGQAPHDQSDSDSPYGRSSFNDGMLEVVGLYSSLHIARLQISLADPVRLGQAKTVKITIKSKSPLPCQVDGEPWEQGASVITITHGGQARMLARGTAPSS